MKLLNLLPFCGLVCSTILFERYEIEENPQFMRTNMSFGDNCKAINVHAEVLQPYDKKIFIRGDFFKKSVHGKQRLILALPKVNYCEATQGLKIFPLITTFLNEMGNRKNNTMSCPVIVKHYYTNNFKVDEVKYGLITRMMDRGRYAVTMEMTDENGRQPVLIYKYTFHIMYTK